MPDSASDCSFEKRLEAISWDEKSPLAVKFDSGKSIVKTRHGRFLGGMSNQVEVVEISTDNFRLWVLPTRGMSIWRLESNGEMFGWDSPVSGPVHPSFVPIHDPNGLGWLEGFDELVVRCGIESNGAPEHNDRGQLVYPLHGRIGNLAAEELAVNFNQEAGRLDLVGTVRESRLFFKKFELKTRLSLCVETNTVEIFDEVTNELATPTTMQLLYHINVGSPVLGKGAMLELPVEELAPKDELSASEIAKWNGYDAPEAGYAERVYFATLRSDENNKTAALLKSANGETGLGVEYDVQNLPRFIIWKNTAADSDGYVTGLEPATNYPNTKSFEREQNRVVELGPGESVSFQVSLHPLTTTDSVTSMSEKIKAIAGEQPASIHRTPVSGWSDI